METLWISIALPLLAMLAFLYKLLIGQKTTKLSTPPGPKPWPIIGNLNLLSPLPHQSLHLLSKKYGEIMQLRFGSLPVVVVSSPEMAREILRTNDRVFANRPINSAGKHLNFNSTALGALSYGPLFREVRRIIAHEIFKPKRLESFMSIRVDERKSLISRLWNISGDKTRMPITLREHLNGYTLSIISRIVAGYNYFSESNDASVITPHELEQTMVQWFKLNGVFNIGDCIPWLNFLDLQGYVKQMKECGRRTDWLISCIIDEHIKRKAENNCESECMVDVLLKAAEDPKADIKLSQDSTKALIMDLLFGGTHTAAATVEWAMIELLKHPNIMDKAILELDRVIGRERWVEEKDFSNLPYINAIIKETFRIHPLASLLPPHYASEDCQVSNYNILKGTIVFVNVWSMGRNPAHWDSPEDFLPDRFLERDIDMMGQSFILLPFGSGRRICPGYLLGYTVVFTALANLLQGFNFKLPKGLTTSDVSRDEVFGIAVLPKFLAPMVIVPRLSPHLYENDHVA